MRGKRESTDIYDHKVPCRMRDALFLMSSLPAWAHWPISRDDFRGGGDRGFETFSSTQKHLGKGERKGNMQNEKKKKTHTKLECRIIYPFFKGGFFFFLN